MYNLGCSFPDMNTLRNRLIAKRREHGLTQQEVARMSGISQAAYQKLESGQAKSSRKLSAIARTLGVTAEWLEYGVDPGLIADVRDRGNVYELNPSGKANVSPVTSRIRAVPEISWVQAGAWTDMESLEGLDLTEVKHWPCPVECSEHTFALRVEGDSMAPTFPQGSIIFVDPEVPAISGKKVVAKLVDQDKATFKQYIEDGDQKMLKAMNPNWPEKYVPINGNCEIVGTVIFAGTEV